MKSGLDQKYVKMSLFLTNNGTDFLKNWFYAIFYLLFQILKAKGCLRSRILSYKISPFEILLKNDKILQKKGYVLTSKVATSACKACFQKSRVPG